MANEVPHVVIVGGGFAGLAAATGLARQPVRITVVDRTNHHLFQPLLYQVATAGLAPSDIAEPIRSILARQGNAYVRLANVTRVDLSLQTVDLVGDSGQTEVVPWDKLVIAAGARHSYFGQDHWAEHAPGLKTLGDALDIRRRILSAFEQAEWTTDPDERAALTTFVVVGAGPTGVELAGAIAELARRTLRRDYRSVDTTRATVMLVEGTHAVLPTYAASLQPKAKQQLEALGVTVRLDTRVTDVAATGVQLGDDFVPARTILWAAGVQGSSLARTLGVELDRAGRVPVGPDCTIAQHPDAFVIGDLAAAVQPDGETPVPGVSPAAMQMGAFVANSIRADLENRSRGTFRYKDRGSLATIGRSRAVADTMGLRFGGFTAWLTWVFVHIWFLVTFRNRIVVMTKWAWAWFTFERATRLVWAPRPGSTATDRP